MFSSEEIARYYDVSDIHYRRHWNLAKSHSLHYGYWDDSTKNFHEALQNINRILADLAGIKEGERVLDAGCGIGGSSFWLAKNKKAIITGISLSEKQIATANTLAQKENLGDTVKFEQKDFTNTDYPPASFDVVWAIESVCHAANKSHFIKEAYRLLKPNGRLIMADFFKKKDISGKDASLIQRWAHGWAVDDFATVEEFEQQLCDAGFSDIKIQNATQAIIPSAKPLYRAWFPGSLLGFVYRIFNPGATAFGKKNVDTARLQYLSLKKDLWSYQVILTLKPR